MTGRVILIPALLAVLAGCGGTGGTPCEDYGNLFNSPNGLILTQAEHPSGWTRPDCFACHQVGNIHCVNRTGIATIDMAAIRDVINSLGLAACVECHGNNGVQP